MTYKFSITKPKNLYEVLCDIHYTFEGVYPRELEVTIGEDAYLISYTRRHIVVQPADSDTDDLTAIISFNPKTTEFMDATFGRRILYQKIYPKNTVITEEYEE